MKDQCFKSGKLVFSVEGTHPETYAVRRCYLSMPAVRGHRSVHLFRWRNPKMVAWLTNESRVAEIRWSSTIFLDMETTGFVRDVDTLVFLVGIAYLAKDSKTSDYRLSIRQYFSRNTLEVGPMLRAIFRKFARPTLIVTFSGSRFDLDLLKAHAIHREVPWPWDDVPELDLARCARKIWKTALKRCNLRTLEREVLGYQRKVDLTGSEIPERWSEFVHNRNPDVLEPVIWHNIEDLLSLPTLLSAMLDDLATPKNLGIKEKLALARHALNIGDEQRTHLLLKKIFREAVEPEDRVMAYKLQQRVARKRGDMDALRLSREAMYQEFPHLRRGAPPSSGEDPTS